MDWTWLTGASGWTGLVQVLARTAIAYTVMLGLLRLGGTRELGQMRPTDLVLLLLVSNAVQNAMVGEETSVAAGVVATATLVAITWAVNRVRLRSARVARLLGGEPVLLAHDGAFVDAHLRREAMTRDDILAALREHGLERIEQAQSVVLEVDGTVSVIERSAPVLRSRHRVRRIRRPPDR